MAVDSTARSYVDVKGVRTAYYERGQGLPVVLIHGGDPRSSSNASDWGRYAELLAAHFRVIAFDKLGQGFTDNPADPRDYTMTAVCEHAVQFVDALGLDELVAVGHSRGALPAVHLALDMPERVRGVIVYDSNTLGPEDPSVPLDFYTRVYADAPHTPDLAYTIREPILNSYSFRHLDDAYLGARLAVGQSESRRQSRLAMETLYEAQYDPDVDAVRQQVLDRVSDGGLAADTLIVWGREDPSAPLPVGLRLFERFTAAPGERRTEFQLVEQSGHYPYREHPGTSAERATTFVASLPALARDAIHAQHSQHLGATWRRPRNQAGAAAGEKET